MNFDPPRRRNRVRQSFFRHAGATSRHSPRLVPAGGRGGKSAGKPVQSLILVMTDFFEIRVGLIAEGYAA